MALPVRRKRVTREDTKDEKMQLWDRRGKKGTQTLERLIRQLQAFLGKYIKFQTLLMVVVQMMQDISGMALE